MGSRVARTWQHPAASKRKPKEPWVGPVAQQTRPPIRRSTVSYFSRTWRRRPHGNKQWDLFPVFFSGWSTIENTGVVRGCLAFVQVSSLTCWLWLHLVSVAFQLTLNRCESLNSRCVSGIWGHHAGKGSWEKACPKKLCPCNSVYCVSICLLWKFAFYECKCSLMFDRLHAS